MNRNRHLGRNTALTQELQDTFVKCLLGACTIRTACQCVGIVEQTYYLWRDTAFKVWDLPMEERTPYQHKCVVFMEAIMAAEGKIKRNLLAISINDARTDGKQAMRILAQRWPDEYSPTRNLNVQVSGADGGPVRMEVMDPRDMLRSKLGQPGVLRDAERLAHAEIQQRINSNNPQHNGNGNGNGNGAGYKI